MQTLRCPICDEPFLPELTKAMPFCSERCQKIDLGRWLNEENGFPVEPEERDDSSPGPPVEWN